MTISAAPLTWPSSFPRYQRIRESGAFKTTLSKALENVQGSLRRFAADSGKKIENLIISSNYTLGVPSPKDPGVAVWFTWDGLGVCIAVDRYSRIEANLQAIHHIIEARRTELRHGTLALVRATFTGFAALPNLSQWWSVFNVEQHTPTNTVRDVYRSLRSAAHPDRAGGSADEFNRVEKAWAEFCKERGIQ